MASSDIKAFIQKETRGKFKTLAHADERQSLAIPSLPLLVLQKARS